MSEKILLVEDDKHIAKLVNYNLKKEGYKVVHEVRGDDGLETLFKEDFDLVILDLMLTDISGLERIGDHSTNLAEWIIFMVSGERKKF